MTSRDWWLLGIGFGMGFLIFSAIGRSAIKSVYKLTEAEVKKLEKKARERAKRPKQSQKILKTESKQSKKIYFRFVMPPLKIS